MVNGKVKKTEESPDAMSEGAGMDSSDHTVRTYLPKSRNNLVIGIVVAVVVAVLVALGVSLFMGGGSEDGELSDAEIQRLLGQVSSHMILPEGEEPAIATIVDAAALIAEQPFYNGAQDGDRVLIYPQAQRAIIYSPSRDIIVNVGPIVVDDGT